MTTEAKRRSIAKWQSENVTRIVVKVYKNTDADIIAFLENCDNKQGLIKQLLREHIKGSK